MSTEITTFADNENWEDYISTDEELLLYPKIDSNLEKKKLEERKLSEEADYKLTIDLFSDFSVSNREEILSEKKEILLEKKEDNANKIKKNHSYTKKEKYEKLNSIKRRIRDAKEYHANLDDIFGSSTLYNKDNHWIDYEDDILK
jgi:hypothetical protein